MNIEKLKMLAELLEEFRNEAVDRHDHDKINSILFDVRFEIEAMSQVEVDDE